MKEFTTAINESERQDGDDDAIEFNVDGTLCRAYRPSDGQLAFLMASTGRHSSVEEQVAGIINFFVATLDDDSHSFVVNRLLDRKDSFGIQEVEGIMEWLVSEWSGRPTKSPSGSTTSPPSTGPSSTPPTPALT